MKNLWKTLPPFLADTFGLIESVNNTDGMTLIDDSAGYRDVPGSDTRGVRAICSDIRMEDVINGTKQKILTAYEERGAELSPSFVLLCSAPASSMIGTDLDDAADEIGRTFNIPAASVNISGHKTYDNGVSKALEAIARLILQKRDIVPGSINIIGENGIDRSGADINRLCEFITDECRSRGLSVTTKWCIKSTASELAAASSASCNLVTTVSGISAAKYMKNAFGIPYIAAVPFGKTWSKTVFDALISGVEPFCTPNAVHPKVLIVGEQLTSNAIRATLELDYGMEGIQVASFFALEKGLMQSGDKRLKGEDDFKSLADSGDYSIIIGDSLLAALMPDRIKFISLPCRAFITPSYEPAPCLCGCDLNAWLDNVL